MMSNAQTMSLVAPLRVRRLRNMLGFSLSASVGVWILVLAVQWTLAEAGESAATVSLVQFAASLPFFLLALPLGAITEFVSHRALLVGTSLVLLAASILLSVLQQLGMAGTPVLMSAVFIAGAGLASVAIVWQALLPHIVSRDMLMVVPAIDGAVFNGARAVGPVVGGAVLAGFGATWAFALIAVLFALCVGISAWNVPGDIGRAATHQPVTAAVGGSLRFIRHSRWTRRLLLRLTMFGIPASCLWGLLPIVAHERLQVSTFEFGVLSGAIGVGAVLGTVALMPVRARLSWNHFVALGSGAYAVVLAGMAMVPWFSVMFVLLVVVGAAWVGVQSTWMIATHAAVPPWIKARVIAFIMLMFQGSQAVGSVLWGVLADVVGLRWAILLSALMMAVSAVEVVRRGIMPSDQIAPDLAQAPAPVAPPPGHEGKWVIIETTYRVVPECASGFVAAMEELRRSRLRLGARRWTLATPADTSDTFVEYCMFKDWSEYRSQETERLTVPEYRLRTLLTEYLVTEPRTRVLIEP